MRTVARLQGVKEPFFTELYRVTPRAQMCTQVVARAASPLDALCTYCDRHAWHTSSTDAAQGEPPSLYATIHASDGKEKPLGVFVQPVLVEKQPLDVDAFKWFGTYCVNIRG
ncbi:MAG: hypothetical protein LC748_10430 [Thermomicrobia bacterium]|nr:hypothetical protein [Thermomicrobia bacterium]